MKKGFTLSEVLITLGVIGVVATITMPTLIQHHQKQQTIAQLKKAYSIVAQAFELSKIDNGEYEYWDLTSTSDPKTYVQKYWIPYLKVLKECDTYSDCGYDNIRPWKRLDGKTTSSEDITGNAFRHAILLNDGSLLSFRIPPDSVANANGTAKISIDINSSKGPNRAGRDYFVMEIYNGKLRPLTIENTLDCTSDNPNSCLSKIVNDGWKISDDYPW